jgi:hypothetical protein
MSSLYPGQGTPLPAHMSRGFWVVKGFIYLASDHTKLPFAAPPWARVDQWNPHTSPPEGVESVGFSAEKIARGMQVSTSELLEANRSGQLRVSMDHVRRGQGHDTTRVCFVFEYLGRRFEVISRI